MRHRAEQEIEETSKRPPLDNEEEDSSPLECLFARLIASGLLCFQKPFALICHPSRAESFLVPKRKEKKLSPSSPPS